MSFFIDYYYSCVSNNYGSAPNEFKRVPAWMCPFKFIGHIWRQLGLGYIDRDDNDDRNIPSKIPNLPPIKYVSCGAYHTLFVDIACPLDMQIIGHLGLLFWGYSLLLW